MVLRHATLSVREARARNGAAVHDGKVIIQIRKVYMEIRTSKSKGDEKTYEKWPQIQ